MKKFLFFIMFMSIMQISNFTLAYFPMSNAATFHRSAKRIYEVDYLPAEYSVPRKVKCNGKTYSLIMKPEFSMLTDEEICEYDYDLFKMIDEANRKAITDGLSSLAMALSSLVWIIYLVKR